MGVPPPPDHTMIDNCNMRRMIHDKLPFLLQVLHHQPTASYIDDNTFSF